jgi:transketolase
MVDVSMLLQKAREIRVDVIKSLAKAKSGHLGASLGLADVFTVLYFYELHHKAGVSDWHARDRLIVSIGHAAPVLYVSLAHTGYFHPRELDSLRQLGSRLQGHPALVWGLPGIETTSGSLGQGLSIAVGMALSMKIDNSPHRVYCVLGDGELQEGSVWEAAMSAAHHQLNNIVAIVDRNEVQIDGNTCDVMNIEPLEEKWNSFGWKVLNCNGNDISELIRTFNLTRKTTKPVVIVAHTVMGKGVKTIEGDYRWHGKAPTDEQADVFISEVNAS